MEQLAPSPAIRRPRAGFFALIRRAVLIRRHRQRLAELGDDTLRDIGISREEALREAARPAWDVPTGWRR